jgi:cysteine desulfurase/selenocysteine lyase
MDLASIRADFPALKHYTWFQNGGVSITPRPVAERHIELMREILERGPVHIVYPDEEYPRRTASMDRLARFFGVEPNELALMRGVSEAYQTVLRGLDWQVGDQLVVSADEEAALLLASLHLAQRRGVEVIKAPLVDDVEGQAEAVAACCTERTRLIGVSHVTTDVGWRLPVERICSTARQRGILTFVDLAHSAGLYPISLPQLGCDFAGALSYKWMFAPYAAGVLYVRRERLKDLAVTYAGGRSEKWLDFETDRFELHDSTQRFQFGPWSWPLVHTWAASVDYLEEIGLENIWQRVTCLADQLKATLQQIPGVTLYTPASTELSAALVSFGVDGKTGAELSQALRQRWNMIIKALPHGREGLRTSVPFFLLKEELERLAEAIETLAGEG